MKLVLLLICFHVFAEFVHVVAGFDPIVATNYGLVRGVVLKSRLDTDFYAFRGIRYAEAPIGNRRFLSAVPANPWDDIFDATEDGPMCIQPTLLETSEDCLRINVFTKQIGADHNRKSVIVYIHGGALIVGSSLTSSVGPENLMDRDIVLVSLNYRLGTLGFLSTGTPECPGNAGFKDQVLALKWVKENIVYFGGDPNSVTLMGQSAGARSVALQIASPMSTGLFQRAIVMSGSTTAQWKVPSNQLDLAKKQAAEVGCPSDTAASIIACLKMVPAQKLADSIDKLNEFASHPILKFFPVVEPDFGQDRFLIEDPNISFKTGNFNRVSIIAGITQDEFASPAWDILKDDLLRNEFDDRFNELAPITFIYERETNNSIHISKTFRETFLRGPLEQGGSLKELNILFADAITSFGVHRFVHLVAHHVPVYYYKNTFVGRYSHFYHPDDKPYGVVHTDDLQYVIYMKSLGPLIKANDPENITIERMTKMWTNFAMTGNPNNSTDIILNELNWTQFNLTEENYLNLGIELKIEHYLFLERFIVWETLFPL